MKKGTEEYRGWTVKLRGKIGEVTGNYYRWYEAKKMFNDTNVMLLISDGSGFYKSNYEKPKAEWQKPWGRDTTGCEISMSMNGTLVGRRNILDEIDDVVFVYQAKLKNMTED